MYKALVVDLDGTLLDTAKTSMNAVNEALVSEGYPPVEEEYFMGICHNGAWSLMKDAAREEAKEKVDVLYQKYIDIYCEKFYAPPYPHVKEVLMELKKNGIKLAVLSNKVIEIVRKQVEADGLNRYFDFIIGEDGTIPLKPNPKGLYMIADRFGVAVKDMLMLGDAQNDIDAAKNAGMDSCFYLPGIGEITNPNSKPTYKIKDYHELAQIMLG